MDNLSSSRKLNATDDAKRVGVENPSWHGTRAAKIIDLMMEGGVGTLQAVDNISAFTHPSNFKARMAIVRAGVQREYEKAACDAENRRIMEMLLLVGLALKDSFDLSLNLQNAEKHGNAALSDEAIYAEVEETLNLLDEFESKDKAVAQSILQSEKERLEMIMAPRRGKGASLFSTRAAEADDSSLRGWVDYWSSFGKDCNLRKLRETTGVEGVDYGVGVLYARYLWGANLVMMNPSLAILALEDDIELNRNIDHLVFASGDVLSRAELIREGTCIAGTKARDALRAVWLLTGSGRISFQVQPSTHATKDELVEDVKSLTAKFNAEALEYDNELFLDELMTPEEIEARKGNTHVFFKVDGSRVDTYGAVEALTLEQLKKGRFSLTEGNTDGLIEDMLGGWVEGTTGEKAAANCNITVNGFVSDVLVGALCQFRGHAKARQKNIPISHSIITRMGGRVEGLGIRWLAMQDVVKGLRRKAKEEQDERADNLTALANDVESKIGARNEYDHTKNGALDTPELREAAKSAGFVLAEELSPELYEGHKGNIFPTDAAIRITAEAITKRSHDVLEALKECDKIKAQGVEKWETLLLQASMRPPHEGRYPHVVEIVAPVGTVVQGHFPNAAMDVEEFEGFEVDPDAIRRPVDPILLSQLENSIVGDEWAKTYEVNESQVKILKELGIYKEEWGNRGMNIEEFAAHPFPQHTLFSKVFPEDEIPKTQEENAAVEKGFIGDFNALGNILLERNEREANKREQLGILADALIDGGLTEKRIAAQDIAAVKPQVESQLSRLEGEEPARYEFKFDSLVQVNGEVHLLAANTERNIEPDSLQATKFSPVLQLITLYSPDSAPQGREHLKEEEGAIISTKKGRRVGVQVSRFDLSNARNFTEKVLPEGETVPKDISLNLEQLVAEDSTASKA